MDCEDANAHGPIPPLCHAMPASFRDRFGGSGMRIWKALLLHKQLEQKQVADFAMLPKEQARQLLYQMVKAG